MLRRPLLLALTVVTVTTGAATPAFSGGKPGVVGVETNLAIVRGAVNGTVPLRGAGFDVTVVDVLDSDGNLVCEPDASLFFFPGYVITFHEPFDGQPTVTLAIHGRAERPHIIQIDDVAIPGGISNTSFAVFMKDAQTNTCASQPWEFIAIGPRAKR